MFGFRLALSCLVGVAIGCGGVSLAETFSYVGVAGGDFYDPTNWEDGDGMNPDGADLPDSSSGAIALDLVMDGVSVVADGQVDFGVGSLTMINGADFSVTGGGNDLDFNSDAEFVFDSSTLTVDGDVIFEGAVSLTGGSIVSETDDVEFQDALTFSVVGTEFSSGDNTLFDAFLPGSSIDGASFYSADRLGLRNATTVLVTDTSINVADGGGDVDDVFDTAGDGSTLILAGTSTLLADTVEEGVDLVLRDSSIATLGGGGVEAVDNGSTLSVSSFDATLTFNAITNDERGAVINGLTGLSYLVDPSNWNVTDWNGMDAVTLRVVGIPEPASVGLLVVASALSVTWRRAKR